MLFTPFVLPEQYYKGQIFFFFVGFTFGLDFSAVLLNKRKNLKLSKILAAQIQCHFLKPLHFVRLSNFIEVSPHNRICSITPNLKQDFSLLSEHIHTSSPSGGEQITRNHRKEKAAGL